MNIAANYEITKIRVNPVGKTIENLEINGEAVTVGEASLQDNKAATIDVSTYTEPVEVTPTEGKDGMQKVTVALENIPSGGSATAYAWKDIDDVIYYTEFSVAPADSTAFAASKELVNNAVTTFGSDTRVQASSYSKIDDDTFGITKTSDPDPVLFTRYAQGDFTLW